MTRLKKNRLLLFIVLSLLLHTTIVGIMQLADTSKVAREEISIEYVEKVVEEPKPEDKLEKEDKRQIVDSSFDPKREKPPEDAKFLSAKDQTVEKETRAKKSGEFKNVTPGAKAKPVAQTKPKLQVDPPPKTLPSLKDLSPNFGTVAVQPDFPKPIKNPAGEGVSQTDDYLKDTAEDFQTMLNTREFVYFSYYSRIRRRLKEYWEPSIRGRVERMLRRGRSIASAKDRITKLVIVLNTKGQLVGVKVIGESGIRDLDDAAVDAFRSAAPFPNPPDGIIEADGTIKIRWDFILEA